MTLSFVITACGGKSTTCSLKSILRASTSKNGTRKCTPVSAGSSNTALAENSVVPTYVVNSKISSEDNVDVYDGLNGYNSTISTGDTAKLVNLDTFTDAEKNTEGAARVPFFYLAPNSVTKVRVYVFLEGQDVDNYDLGTIGKKIAITFGFTKDKFDMAAETTTTSSTEASTEAAG